MDRVVDDLLKEGIANTENEIFNEATGKDAPSNEGGPGDRSVEEMGTGQRSSSNLMRSRVERVKARQRSAAAKVRVKATRSPREKASSRGIRRRVGYCGEARRASQGSGRRSAG